MNKTIKLTDSHGNHHYGWWKGESYPTIDNNTHNFIHHRIDGPAYEVMDESNQYTQWWINNGRIFNFFAINGTIYSNFKEFQKAGRLTDDQMTILKLKYGEIKEWYIRQ